MNRALLKGSGDVTVPRLVDAPDDMIIAICAGPERRPDWEWVKWLPHNLHPSRTDALGHVRLVASTGPDLERLLEDVIGNRPRFNPMGASTSSPHVVIVLDGIDLKGATQLDDGIDGVTVLDLDELPPRLLDRSLLVLETEQDYVRYGIDPYHLQGTAFNEYDPTETGSCDTTPPTAWCPETYDHTYLGPTSIERAMQNAAR